MLEVFNSLESLDFRQLMDVYEQWNRINGIQLYPKLTSNLQILYAEQDFYHFLKEFFSVTTARYFLWIAEGHYKAALRIEPYTDGYLLEALETAPTDRRKGYATELVRSTLRYMASCGKGKIYSHIAVDNIPSLSVHQKCGFTITQNEAIFIDGSKHMNYHTLVCEY